MIKLLLIVGTRPNYIKITQFKKVAETKFKGKFNIKIVHTGQHFDKSMADVFFHQLNIWPDYFLEIPQASANTQIGEIMFRLEKVISEFKPQMIVVPGDVNSTLAAAITANKIGVPLAHLESGLRSFDRTMPEEINRILVDEISDLCFITEQSGIDNLLKEGKNESMMHLVGNTMIDTLVAFEKDITKQTVLKDHNIIANDYVLLTIHRPATVDDKVALTKLLSLLKVITIKNKVVFPMHPRTLKNIDKFGLTSEFESLQNYKQLKPLDYLSFQNLIHNCKMVITDSGGIQEETTFKGKPCLTLRPNTERPITITEGTNTLLHFDEEFILNKIEEINANNYKTGKIPNLWDGKATERILSLLLRYFNN